VSSAAAAAAGGGARSRSRPPTGGSRLKGQALSAVDDPVPGKCPRALLTLYHAVHGSAFVAGVLLVASDWHEAVVWAGCFAALVVLRKR
jgi:hypothetical protein